MVGTAVSTFNFEAVLVGDAGTKAVHAGYHGRVAASRLGHDRRDDSPAASPTTAYAGTGSA
jgi:hypothetical protein